jgi:hypothetical protein
MRSAVIVWAVLSLGAASAFVALGDRGNTDDFTSLQTHPPQITGTGSVTAAAVAARIARAPEPVAANLRTAALRTHCRSGGAPPFGNPWTCSIRYASGHRAEYLVEVNPDGSYSAIGTGQLNGCCISVPTQE